MSDPIPHDPNAELDYTWDWSSWLGDGETITAQTVTAPAGVIVSDVTTDGATVTAWLSATDATTQVHRVVCRVTTSQGRKDDRSIPILITHR